MKSPKIAEIAHDELSISDYKFVQIKKFKPAFIGEASVGDLHHA